MYLEFEIKNNQIKRKNIEDDYEYKNQCSFFFHSKEWNHLEKYVIFWTDKNKSIIRYLGEGCQLQCQIPEELTDVFSIQVYANDEIKTNKIEIGTTIKQPKEKCKKPIKKCDTNTIFYDIYQQLEQKIDSIKYIDNTFYIYSSNKLIKSVNLYDKDLIKKIIEDEIIKINIDTQLSPDSDNAVQNKTIYNELSKKENSVNLSRVARTGDYNDLKNLPESFQPSKHMHTKEDLINFDYNVDEDIEIILMKLTDNILGM